MARSDALHLEIFGGVLKESRLARTLRASGGTRTYSCKFEDLGSKVFENSSNVNGSLGANTHLVLGVLLEKALDTATGELRA